MLQNVPRMYVVGAVLLIAMIAGGGTFYYQFVRGYHFVEVRKGVLYRDGFRSEREFNIAIANAQPKWVVTLLDQNEIIKEPFNKEIEYLSRTRIKGVAIPIPLGGYPTTADVQKFLTMMEKQHYHPILIHCAQGIRRTGMMVAAYQMSIMGWDKEKAKAEILSFGHSDRTINDIKRFIDVYDPVKREVTQNLGKGTE